MPGSGRVGDVAPGPPAAAPSAPGPAARYGPADPPPHPSDPDLKHSNAELSSHRRDLPLGAIILRRLKCLGLYTSVFNNGVCSTDLHPAPSSHQAVSSAALRDGSTNSENSGKSKESRKTPLTYT